MKAIKINELIRQNLKNPQPGMRKEYKIGAWHVIFDWRK